MSSFVDEIIHLGNAGTWSGGGTPSKANADFWDNGDIPWVSPKDMKTFELHDSQDKITAKAVEASPAKLVPAGSVLMVVRSGILAHTFPVAIARRPVTLNQDMKAITPKAGLSSEFLAYQLRAQASTILNSCTKSGTTVASVETKQLQALPFWVPSIELQSKIVEGLDKQLSRLDEAVTTLQGIQAKLKQARASILTAAVEGRLVETEAELARIENRKYEHARDLIAASLKLREQQHESVQQTQGRKRTYRKPTSASHILSQDASLLPPGWAYASTEEVTSGNPYSLAIGPFGSNLKVSDYKDRGVPLVFVKNVRSNIFSMDNAVFVSHEKANELKAHAAEPGDLLITKMGDPPGDSAIYPSGLPHPIITADVIRLNPSDRFDVQYLLYATKSSFFRLQIQLATKGVAQKKVSLERFSKIHFPIPPYAEQVRIVNEIDRRFSVLDQVEATVQTSLARCGLLRQAILKRAFGG